MTINDLTRCTRPLLGSLLGDRTRPCGGNDVTTDLCYEDWEHERGPQPAAPLLCGSNRGQSGT
jgi:hypothetical protein